MIDRYRSPPADDFLAYCLASGTIAWDPMPTVLPEPVTLCAIFVRLVIPLDIHIEQVYSFYALTNVRPANIILRPGNAIVEFEYKEDALHALLNDAPLCSAPPLMFLVEWSHLFH